MPATETVALPMIRRLPPSVVNKIAAGEVIERPASVVKELLENAVDAGARRIDVAVEQGGLARVRVADDGHGIPADQLLLAVTSHATSKLADAADLFRVRSLGFRGEALASIAEVSRMVLRSRPADAPAGAEVQAVAGEITGPQPCGCTPGTVIDVRDLFLNTPVRRKFLRTTQTEMSHVTEALTRIALGFPDVHFSLAHNDRSVFDLRAVDDWRERIAIFFGEEVADGLIWVESEDEAVRISGYVANPNLSRSNNRMQYLLLNGRHIRDRSLQHALAEAYRGLLMTGRFPVAFLRLEMPAELVDVNVHPTKLEVRFEDGRRIYSQLLAAIRNRFLTSDLTARWRRPNGGVESADSRAPTPSHAEFADWAGSPSPALDAEPSAFDSSSRHRPWSEDGPEARPNFADRMPSLRLHRLENIASPQPAPGTGPLSANTALNAVPPGGPTLPRPGSAAIQVLNRYLVTESEHGVVVIDQHALHERILYEEIKERVSQGELERQRLLVPEPVDLPARDFAVAMENREHLAKLGFELELFGGETVLVQSYPALMRHAEPGEVLKDLLGRMSAIEHEVSRAALWEHLLNSMACKAAIKAGDPLTIEEVHALLALRHLARDAHHCPHGRPTALVFTREELDRQFKRT